MKIGPLLAAATVACLVGACVNISSLTTEFDESGVPENISTCKSSSVSPTTVARLQQIKTLLNGTQVTMPEKLRNDAVLNAVYQHVQHIKATADSVSTRLASLPPGTSAAIALKTSTTPPPAKPVTALSASDFATFANLISEFVFRQSGGVTANDFNNPNSFGAKLTYYYQQYYNNKFVTYFGQKVPAPSLSTTITDDEIDQAATVLLELISDIYLEAAVWTSGSNYYPAANSNEPTGALYATTVLKQKLPQLSTNGCGMNATKASIVSYVAQKFSMAASADAGLTIKSAGGLNIGLGVLGKLSIGDNQTLSKLVQAVASEIILRLTAEAGVAMLSNLDFGAPTSGASPQGMALMMVRQPTAAQSVTAMRMSALFTSANGP